MQEMFRKLESLRYSIWSEAVDSRWFKSSCKGPHQQLFHAMDPQRVQHFLGARRTRIGRGYSHLVAHEHRDLSAGWAATAQLTAFQANILAVMDSARYSTALS